MRSGQIQQQCCRAFVGGLCRPSLSKSRTGRPRASQTTCDFLFNSPFVHPIRREAPPFSRLHAIWCVFRCVASIMSRSGGLPSSTKCNNNSVEHSNLRPACEPVIQGFMRPIGVWCISPAQAVTDHMNDATDDAPTITARQPIR